MKYQKMATVKLSSDEISAQTKKFLSVGGEIEKVGHAAKSEEPAFFNKIVFPNSKFFKKPKSVKR